MREININTESPCAKTGECCTATHSYARNKWLKDEELYVADERVFIKVRIATPTNSELARQYRLCIDVRKTYFMDAITGTLYFEDGKCVSSNQIKNRNFVRNDVQGKKILSKVLSV